MISYIQLTIMIKLIITSASQIISLTEKSILISLQLYIILLSDDAVMVIVISSL